MVTGDWRGHNNADENAQDTCAHGVLKDSPCQRCGRTGRFGPARLAGITPMHKPKSVIDAEAEERRLAERDAVRRQRKEISE